MTEHYYALERPKKPQPAFVARDLSWLHTEDAWAHDPDRIGRGQHSWSGTSCASETPWHRSEGWHGIVESADDAPATEVPRDYRSVVRVLAHGCASDYVVGLALLVDGRYVAWESEVDVTGTGFHEDAYGGNATIIVAMSPRAALLKITESSRETLHFATDPSEAGLVLVLHDAWLQGQSRSQLYRLADDSGEFGELFYFRGRTDPQVGRMSMVRKQVRIYRPTMRWTGPLESDLDPSGNLRAPVPKERWPYGPPNMHEGCCQLHAGGLFCDCAASDADDTEWGEHT